MQRKKIMRALDANFNRAREGLRVVEDIFRFIHSDNALRNKVRKLRHSFSTIAHDKDMLKEFTEARDVAHDGGRKNDALEYNRRNAFDVVYANFQRAKESARVLEELFKMIDKKQASSVKKLRYKIYAAEKEVIKRWNGICNS